MQLSFSKNSTSSTSKGGSGAFFNQVNLPVIHCVVISEDGKLSWQLVADAIKMSLLGETH